MLIVDTDILVWLLKGNAEIKEKFTETAIKTKGYLFITPIQIAEIYAGIREKEKIETESFLDSFYFIDIKEKTGRIAGEFISEYGKSHNVTLADAMIAASAKISGFKLWTLNKKHYPMFEQDEFL